MEIVLVILYCVFFWYEMIFLPRKLSEPRFTPGKILDVCNYALFVFGVICWIIFQGKFTLLGPSNFTDPDLPIDISLANSIFSTLYVFFIYSTSSIFNLFIILIILLRDFQKTRALHVVTKSIVRSAVDLIYFTIVLMIVFLIYGFIGFYYFGPVDPQFRTPISSAESLFNWMAGAVSFDLLYDRRPGISHIYCWSWVVFYNLILLNMLVAIIIESYQSIKEEYEHILEMENKSKKLDFHKSCAKWFYRQKVKITKRKKHLTNLRIRRTLLNDDFRDFKIITPEMLEEFTPDWTAEERARVMKRFGKKNKIL